MSRPSPFPRIRLPQGIAFALCGPADAVQPLPEERALLSPQALPERIAEFARGRAAARRALQKIGVADAERIPILREGARAPRWPAGIVGAIAHSAGWAAAACAQREAFRGVGIDLERVRPVKQSLAARIARPDELAAWLALPAARQPLAFTRMFSAKESIYKALFPATGVFLGYQDASVSWTSPAAPDAPEDEGERGFAWTLHKDSGADYPAGYHGNGRAWLGGGMVLTALWIKMRPATPC